MGGGAGRGLDFGATWGSGRLPLAEIGTNALFDINPYRKLDAEETAGRNQLIDDELVAKLEHDGVKFSRENIVFITRDKTGQIVWLEKGNAQSGLEHMRARGHMDQLSKAFEIPAEKVERYLHEVISLGAIVKNELKPVGNRMGYERIYFYEGKYSVITAIGTNGFIISAYPRKYKKES